MVMMMKMMSVVMMMMSVSVAGGNSGKELAELDAARGGGLRRWAADESAEAASKVLALAGDEETQGEALEEALKEWNPRLARETATLRISRDATAGPGTVLDETARWLRTRVVAGELKWSVVFVENADRDHETIRDVSEMVAVFGDRKRCVDAENDLEIPRCGRLLIVLGTRFGADVVRAYRDTLEVEVAVGGAKGQGVMTPAKSARAKLDEACRREANIAFARPPELRSGLGRLMLSGARQLVYPLFGAPTLSDAQELVERVRRERARRSSPSDDGSLPPQPPVPSKISDACIDDNVIRRAGFVGQPHVIEAVKSLLRQIRHGWRSGDGPVVLLFAGPAGLGKTLLAKLLASAYNCGMPKQQLERENVYKEIDMVNYQDERSVDGFVDPAPGLAGSGIMADLFSNSLRNVVLLDEIEKCHPSLVEKMLLPMLDNNGGHVQAKKSGKVFPTRESIFVMTTNCFSDEIAELYRSVQSGSDGFDRQAFGRLSEAVAMLMQDPSKRCRGSHTDQANPFSSGPFWRRLVAGASAATRHGVLPFVPPSADELNELVRITLEAYCTQSAKKEIFYSRRALEYLQSTARSKLLAGTLSSGTVEAFIVGEVNEAIPESLLFSNVRNIVLYQSPVTGALQALDDGNVGAEDCVPEREAAHSHTGGDSSSRSSSETASASNSKTSAHEVEEREPEGEQAKVQDWLSDVEIVRTLLFAAMAVVVTYLVAVYAVVPALKMIVTVVAVVGAILYAVFPEYFVAFMELLFELVRWLYNNWRIAIPAGGGLYFLLLFLRARRRSELEKKCDALAAENALLRASEVNLEAKSQKLEQEVRDLEARNASLAAEGDALRDATDRLQAECDTLRARVDVLQSQKDADAAQVKELQAENASVRGQVEQLREEKAALEKDLAHQQQNTADEGATWETVEKNPSASQAD